VRSALKPQVLYHLISKATTNIAVLKLLKAKDKKLNKGSQELFLTKIPKITFINGPKEAERKWHIPHKNSQVTYLALWPEGHHWLKDTVISLESR